MERGEARFFTAAAKGYHALQEKHTRIIFGRLGALVACSWHVTEAEPFSYLASKNYCVKSTQKSQNVVS